MANVAPSVPSTELTRRYPKRKRVDVCYTEVLVDPTEDLDVVQDGEVLRVRKKAREASKSAKGRSRHPFLFMSLMPELRNQIYEFALTDPHGIHLRSSTSKTRRGVVIRCIPADCRQPRRSYRRLGQNYPLSLALLSTCKAIYAEAAPIFYSQRFTFVDNYVLHGFLMNRSPATTGLLRDISIKHWCTDSEHKSINLPAFQLLRDAVNLWRLKIDCRVSWTSTEAITVSLPAQQRQSKIAACVARHIYRDCYPWLEAMEKRKGGRGVWRAVIDIQEDNIRPSNSSRSGNDRLPRWTHENKEETEMMVRDKIQELLDQKA